MAEHRYLQVTTTFGTRGAADELAGSAVHARLAACAQVIGPIQSTYWWQGKVETSTEWMVLYKTTSEKYPTLQAHIVEHHSYEMPEIVAVEIVEGSPTYLAWIAEMI